MTEYSSKLTSKAQTVVPREIRRRLDLRPGDTLRYRVTDAGVVIEKAEKAEDDPFTVFTEWSDELDERAFHHLQP